MGESIEDKSHRALLHVGELQVVSARGGNVITHPENTVVAPPRHMSADRITDVAKWHQDTLREGIVNVVTNTLKPLGRVEASIAMELNGKLQQSISSYISNSVEDWPKFLSTYARDQVARDVNLKEPKAVADAIARGYLQQIRSGMRANTAQVTKFFAQKELEAISGRKAEDRPLFGTVGESVGTSQFSDAACMWREIAEDAMYHGRTERIPIAAIYDGHQRVCAPIVQAPTRRRVLQDVVHPLTRLGMDSSIAQKAYPGDSDRALAMYHLFSGKPTAIGCHSCSNHGKNGKKGDKETCKSNIGSNLPTLVPIRGQIRPMPVGSGADRPLPRLVPIGAPWASAASDRPLPRLVPIGSSAADAQRAPLPRLVPIGSSAADASDRPMPKLVPISGNKLVGSAANRAMPPLVTIRSVLTDQVNGRARGQGGRKKKPVRKGFVGDPLDVYDLEEPLFVGGFDDLPNLDDFL